MRTILDEALEQYRRATFFRDLKIPARAIPPFYGG